MIWNIIDHRKRPYRWKKVRAIIENTYHDNSVKDADQCEMIEGGVWYAERSNILLHDAIKWAEEEDVKVTLFLYD